MPSTAVFVIPAYNEGAVLRGNLERLIRELEGARPQVSAEIVVVDDGSRDGTHAASAGLPVHRLRHPLNLGQGAALQTGFDYVLRHVDADFVVTFDADGQHRLEDALSMIEAAESEPGLDAVLGSRFLPGGGTRNMPSSRGRMLKVATIFTQITTGLAVTDTHNGLRVLRRRALKSLRITQNGMSHASQILALIARHGLRYREHPVVIEYSDYSLRKGQKLSNSINILWEMLSEKLKT